MSTRRAPKLSGGQTRPSAKPSRRKEKTGTSKPPAEQVKRLFGTLSRQLEGEHWGNAVKTCDKILRIDPTDADAQKAKLWLLFELERWSDALSLAENESLEAEFEHAYALVRLHRLDTARADEVKRALKSLEGKENERGVKHLDAQFAFRQNDYETSLRIYNELLDTCPPDSEEHTDIVNNISAAQALADFIQHGFRASLPSTSDLSLPVLSSSTIPAAAAVAAAVAETQEEKPKKVRMRRVPKGVVPGVTPPPDPERWLKKSERTNAPHTRRRKGGGGGATQGAAAPDAGTSGAPISVGGGSSASGKAKKGKKKR